MIFADLAVGDAVFLDANTFVYQFAPDPTLGPACAKLFERIENQDLVGFTSIHMLGEVAHKLMTIEAHSIFGWPLTGMANRLRRHPIEVQKLTAFKTALHEIEQSKIHILDASFAVLLDAAQVCQQLGLLINDSLVVSIMRQNGLVHLASHDSDFDRVPGIKRYAPA